MVQLVREKGGHRYIYCSDQTSNLIMTFTGSVEHIKIGKSQTQMRSQLERVVTDQLLIFADKSPVTKPISNKVINLVTCYCIRVNGRLSL